MGKVHGAGEDRGERDVGDTEAGDGCLPRTRGARHLMSPQQDKHKETCASAAGSWQEAGRMQSQRAAAHSGHGKRTTASVAGQQTEDGGL